MNHNDLPTGKLTGCYGKYTLIDDLPRKMIIFHSYVSLLESNKNLNPHSPTFTILRCEGLLSGDDAL